MDDLEFLQFAVAQLEAAADDLREINSQPLHCDGADWWQHQEQLEQQQAIFLPGGMTQGHKK